MKEYPSKNEIEKTLNEIIPFNPQLVSKELSIFDQIVAKSQSEKSPTAQDISRLADTAAPPSTWSIADISDITVSAEEKASVSSIFDINADADVMNVMTAYNPINATKQDAKAQSVLEGLNPYPKLQETEVTTNNDDFVELSKTYGQPEIVRLNDAKTAIDVYTTPQSGSENFTKNTLPTLPGFPAGIKAASILSDSAIEPQYNQVAAINGPQHNRLAPGSAAICSEKMVATAYNYANDKKDKDKASNSKNADKKSKLEYWLDYAEKVMAAGECSNQLVLHYQSFATELLCPGVSEPQATEVQWQTLNIIDEFYSQSYDGWSPLNPLKTYHFNNVPQKVNTVDNKPLVTVSDLQSYSDGMSNRFIYGTLKVNFFYNIGFMIRMVEGKPVVKFFAPSESANSFEPKYNYLFELIGKLYPQAQWGSADAQDIIQDSKIPPVFADSEVFDQTLKPFGQIDTDCVGFYYKSFDREHFARVHIYNVPNATMLIFVDQLDKSDIRFYGKVDKVATIEVKRGESAFDDQIRYAPPRSGNKLAYYILPNHGLYLREAIKTDDTYTLSLVNAWQGGINAIPCQLTLTDDGGYDIQYEQNAAPNKSFVKSYDSFVMVDEKGDKKNYKDLWFNTLVEQDTSSRRLSDIISKGDVEYHYSTNHQGMLRVIISISNHENEGGNLIIACNEKGTRGSLSQYETQNSVHSPEFYPPMPVAHNIQKKSLLPWDHYLQDTEIVFTNDKEKYIDKDRKIVYGEDGKKQKSYFHASCDSMENGWMLYELEQQVTEAEKAASDSRLYGYGKRHQVELQVVNPYGIPLSLPEGACIEYRLSSQARLIDRSNPADPVCIHSNRTVSYTANMVGSSKSVFEINLGHEDDIVAGTSLFYRIVSNDAFEQGDQQAPVMRLNTSTPLQSGESLTTQWKSFNISYKLLQRMDSDHFDQAQPGNSNKTTPAQLLRENADKGKYSDETAKQLAEGYSKLYQVSKPKNGVYLRPLASAHQFLMQNNATNVNPMMFITVSTDTALQVSSFWDFFSPANWLKAILKTVKKVLVGIIEAVKTVIDTILTGLAGVLDYLGADGLANGVRKLQSFIDTIISAVQTFVSVVLDVIIAIIDMQRGYQIGQVFKALCLDNFGNAESPMMKYVGNGLTELSELAKSKIETFRQDANQFIDDNLGKKGANFVLASNEQGQDEINKFQHFAVANGVSNNTEHNYLSNQVSNALCTTGGTAVMSLANHPMQGFIDEMSGLLEPLGRLIVDLGANAFDLLKDLLSFNFENIGPDVGELLKDVLNPILDILLKMLDLLQKLPQMIAAAIQSIDAAVGGLFGGILTILGIVFLGKPDAFNSFADLGFFMLGQLTNISVSVVDGMMKLAGQNGPDDTAIFDTITQKDKNKPEQYQLQTLLDNFPANQSDVDQLAATGSSQGFIVAFAVMEWANSVVFYRLANMVTLLTESSKYQDEKIKHINAVENFKILSGIIDAILFASKLGNKQASVTISPAEVSIPIGLLSPLVSAFGDFVGKEIDSDVGNIMGLVSEFGILTNDGLSIKDLVIQTNSGWHVGCVVLNTVAHGASTADSFVEAAGYYKGAGVKAAELSQLGLIILGLADIGVTLIYDLEQA